MASQADWLIDPSPFRATVQTGPDASEVELANGLVRRIIRIKPAAATVALDNLVTGEALVRSARPEALLELNGIQFKLGGLTGQPAHNFLKPEWLASMKADPAAWICTGWSTGRTEARFAWKPRREWLSTETVWPPPGVRVTFDYEPTVEALADVKASVHYELYDGLPLFAKWITISNASRKAVTLNTFTVEQLAVVEPESAVDGPASAFRSYLRNLEAFSDYAFGGMMTGDVLSPGIRWKTDPLFRSQVHYERQTPCLLEAASPLGPETSIEPGGRFESWRVFELVHDGTDRERRGLALRRAYRTLAPWVQENPVLMHVRSARPDAVKSAVDQCADVGFEMVIMTFGSGFNIESEKPEYLAQIKELADYARGKGIALGGYSLLASRSINAENDCINPTNGQPGGMRFGSSPCIGSRWGQDYFRKLYQFFEKTGCGILEHDGSYPGDVCASTNHPGHRGLKDSQWTQWKTISGFYQWCRAQGIYLNVPDWYYLSGSTKCGMGYREDNWSLPRDQQEIIERQNVFDGTWEKTPSMGWMFVPLTEYHGGGAAATIEPLKDHLEHYETRLANLFGAGVQACYRGPRLYDAPETRAVVKRWVDFYKQHRAILDSDLIHLRRPDGRDWDGWLHVNPRLKERGLAMVYNPLPQPVERTIRLPLYYAGLTDRAVVKRADGTSDKLVLARDFSAAVKANIPARGRTWLIVEAPAP
ncbi:MAG: hypothetical protein HZA90_15315 [Verrucomicrobia bacterium]|nr:hypothetical protein [Verrucomicrobiota bacterium]